MAEPLRFTGIDHISLAVKDPQRSVDFYARVFGSVVRKEAAAEHYYVRVGSGYVALSGVAAGSAVGAIDHFCAAFDGVWLAPIRGHLREIGINFSEPDPFGLAWPDPFGIHHELWTRDSWLDLARTAPVLSRPTAEAPLFQPVHIDNVNIGVINVWDAAPYYDKLFAHTLGMMAGPKIEHIYRIGKSTLTLRRATEAPAIESAAILVREIPTGTSAKLRELGATPDSAVANKRINFRDPDGVKLSVVVA